MFLEWWMIAVLFVVWFVSMINHGQTSYNSGTESGAEATLEALNEGGFIEITDEGDIIGLCNSDEGKTEDK
jgi:hypothetical protein